MAEFKLTGMEPIKPLIFSEAGFMPSFMTDRIEPISPSTYLPTNVCGATAEVYETYMLFDPPSISLRNPSTSSHLD